MISSRFNLSLTSKPLNLSLLRFNERFGSKNLGFTHRPKLQSKSPFNQSIISQFRSLGVEIWIQRNLPSLPHDLPQFPPPGDYGSKFQTCWTTFSPWSWNLRAKAHSARNIFTIPNLRVGNMGIGEPSLSSSQPPSISSSRWLWVKVSNLLNHVFPIELKLESKNPLS